MALFDTFDKVFVLQSNFFVEASQIVVNGRMDGRTDEWKLQERPASEERAVGKGKVIKGLGRKSRNTT